MLNLKNSIFTKLNFLFNFREKTKVTSRKKGWKIIPSLTTIEGCVHVTIEGLSFCSFVTMCNFEKKIGQQKFMNFNNFFHSDYSNCIFESDFFPEM